MKLKRKAIVIHNGDYVEHLLKLGEQSQEPSELIKKYLKEYKQDIKDNRFNWEIFDELLISIKEHEKIVNKIQTGFIEISNNLANQMLRMDEVRLEKENQKLKQELKELKEIHTLDKNALRFKNIAFDSAYENSISIKGYKAKVEEMIDFELHTVNVERANGLITINQYKEHKIVLNHIRRKLKEIK